MLLFRLDVTIQFPKPIQYNVFDIKYVVRPLKSLQLPLIYCGRKIQQVSTKLLVS